MSIWTFRHGFYRNTRERNGRDISHKLFIFFPFSPLRKQKRFSGQDSPFQNNSFPKFSLHGKLPKRKDVYHPESRERSHCRSSSRRRLGSFVLQQLQTWMGGLPPSSLLCGVLDPTHRFDCDPCVPILVHRYPRGPLRSARSGLSVERRFQRKQGYESQRNVVERSGAFHRLAGVAGFQLSLDHRIPAF